MEAAFIHVLLVEDDPDATSRVCQMLDGSPQPRFVIRSVNTLAAALAADLPEESSVVLLNLTLRDSKGFDTFAAAARRWTATPIVVLSATADESLALRAVREGAQDYLTKGRFDAELLVRAVRYAVGRKHAELALARERNLLRNLIDGLPDHIYAKDLQGRFIVVNKATQRFFGASTDEEMIGKTDFDYFPPDAASSFRFEEQEMIRGAHPPVDREAMVVSMDGSATEAWLRTHKAPFRDAHGRVLGIVGLNRDVTERRRAREQLERSNAILADRQRELLATLADLERSHRALKAAQLQLVQAEKMESIGRLAAGVAHEVKNPLAVVKLGVEYLAHDGPGQDPATATVLRTVADAVHRADDVVRGLMDYAAPAALSLAPTSLSAVIDRSVGMLRYEMGRSHVALRAEVPTDLPLVQADACKVEQVLLNLFINAVQAMPGGGSLTVRARSGRSPQALDDGTAGQPAAGNGHLSPPGFAAGQPVVVVDVDDTGCGIPEQNLEKLSEPFFTTKPPGLGNGLGLSVSRTIMELHGGTLRIRNRPEGGARATLVFKVDGV